MQGRETIENDQNLKRPRNIRTRGSDRNSHGTGTGSMLLYLRNSGPTGARHSPVIRVIHPATSKKVRIAGEAPVAALAEPRASGRAASALMNVGIRRVRAMVRLDTLNTGSVLERLRKSKYSGQSSMIAIT